MVTEARDSHIDKVLKWQTIYHPIPPTEITIDYDELWYAFSHTYFIANLWRLMS